MIFASNEINCVKGEIHNMLTVLRVNARWGSEKRFKEEVPLQAESGLVRAFKALYDLLEDFDDLSLMDTVQYLEPFLAVVRSPQTSGLNTGAALSSIHKFLLYGFLSPEGVRVREGINRIAQAITECQFEMADAQSDQVVVMKLLELSTLCIRSEMGTFLTDQNIWEIFCMCHKVSCQWKGLLSSTAGNALAHIVLVVFSQECRWESIQTNSAEGFLEDQSDLGNWDEEGDSSKSDGAQYNTGANDQESSESTKERDTPDECTKPIKSVLVQIMGFLASLCDPRTNERENCILALSLINIALEAGGNSLGQCQPVVRVLQMDICRHLLALSQAEDLAVLSLTLRVIFNLFNSIKDHLKVQLEVFLTSVHLRILQGSSYSPEQQELALESLLEFCREPSLMADLYINYDCDVQCTNLFETICVGLAKQAVPAEGCGLNILNRLALEGILAIIEAIAKRCHASGTPTSESAISTPPVSKSSDLGCALSKEERDTEWLARARQRTAEVLQQRKKMKNLLTLAAEQFNSEQKGFVKYAQELGLLPTPIASAGAVAKLLHTAPGLNKTKLGEYLSKGPVDRYPFNAQVLGEYCSQCDFKGKSFDQSLRLFLECFRLPGEAQCIDRLMEAFAAEFFNQNQHDPLMPFQNTDAAFILAFSVIMLNTDLHNPQIKDSRRMTVEDFLRNNRDINDGGHLPEDFLRSIYDSIKENEIQVQQDLMDMTASTDGSVREWEGLMRRRTGVVSGAFTNRFAARKHQFPAGVHEKDMFSSVAEAAFTAMITVFERSRDDLLVLKCLHGLESYAHICVYFELPRAFNTVLASLFRYGRRYIGNALETGLPQGARPDLVLEKGVGRQMDMATFFTCAEGVANHRGLVALRVGLDLIFSCGDSVQDAWADLVECLFEFGNLGCLPAALCDIDDFADQKGVLLAPSVFSVACQKRMATAPLPTMVSAEKYTGGGLWNSLTSLVFTTSSPPQEESDPNQELKRVVAALKTVAKSSKLDRLFPVSKSLSLKAVERLVNALLSSRDPTSLSISHDMNSPDNINHPRFEGQAVLALELSIRVLMANRKQAAALWPLFHNYAEKVTRGGVGIKGKTVSYTSKVPFLVERVMVNTIRSCIHLLDSDTVRPLLFQTLALFIDLGFEFVSATSRRLTSGLLFLVHANAPFIGTNAMDWSIFFDLLEMALPFENTWQIIWETLTLILERSILNDSNIDRCYSLLLWFVNGAFDPLERTSEQIPVNLPHELIQQGLMGLLKFNLILFGQDYQSYESMEAILPAFEDSEDRPGVLESSWTFHNGLQSPDALGTPEVESELRSPSPESELLETSGILNLASSGAGNPQRSHNFTSEDKSPPEEIRESESASVTVIADQSKAEALWVDTLKTLKTFMDHPSEKVARIAADCLQRLTLLTTQIHSLGSWQACMKDILLQLPIVLSIKQSKIAMGIVTSSSEEVCLRCSTLLSRTFLNNLQVWVQLEDFHVIWLKMISLLGYNVKHSPPGSVMHESTLQVIQNMVMVIDHAGVFEQSNTVNYQHFVDQTWNILDSTSPSLRRSLLNLAPNLMSKPPEESLVVENCPESNIEAYTV